MRRALTALALLTAATLLTGPAFAQDGTEKTPKPPVAKPLPDEGAETPETPEVAKNAGAEEGKAAASKPETKSPAVDPTQRDFDAYKIRVADKLNIIVYKFPDLTQTYDVPANGHISFPPVGKVSLLGKTVFEIEEIIRQGLKDGGYVQDPNVGVIVTKYADREVAIIGAVQRVVKLPTHKNIRLLELLARAGTLDQTAADFSRVTIRRIGADGSPFSFDVAVADILERGQQDKNVVVREDDIIVVPRLQGVTPQSADWVYVIGKVRNPGRHPIIPGRTSFTLTKLIAIVGDFEEFADRSKIKIIRETSTGRRFIPIDLDDIIEGDAPDFELQPDDLVYVPESWI